jgi:hypothetical protein
MSEALAPEPGEGEGLVGGVGLLGAVGLVGVD